MSPPASRLRNALLVFLAVAGLSAASAFFYFQHSLRETVAHHVSERVGADTRVGLAHVTLFPRGVQLASIDIRNPDGFDNSHFLRTRRIHTAITGYDHRSRILESSAMTFDGMTVWIERKGGRSNYRIIQEHLRQFDRKHRITRADKTKLIIRELRISDLEVRFQSGSHDRESVVPEIVLNNIGAGRGGVTMGELAGIVTDAVLRAALRNEARRKLDEYLEEETRELGRKLEKLFD